MKALIVLALSALTLLGCEDESASPKDLHTVTLYANDKEIRSWTAIGRVYPNDAGFYFIDATTGKGVQVRGTVTVEHREEE